MMHQRLQPCCTEHCSRLQFVRVQRQASRCPAKTKKGSQALLSCKADGLNCDTKLSRHVRRSRVAVSASLSSDGTSKQAGSSASKVYDVVVVGGGLSGLVTGMALKKKHGDQVSSFLITEARERVGGNITSMEGNGYVWEEGPNSFQPNDAMLQVAVDANCDKDLVFGDPKAPRFVYWEKKLRATPSGPDALTFDLLSLWGKIRAGLGAVGIYKQGPMPGYEETVEQFIRRNLGKEVFERLIEPFCSGVYAGDPAKLSMKAAFNKIWSLEADGGSLVGGAVKLFQDRKANPPPPRDPRLPPKPKGQTVGSFRKGLKMLPEAISNVIGDHIRCNWLLESISRDKDGVFTLTYSTPEGPQQVRSRAVGLTAPAYVVAKLLEKHAPSTAAALNSFDYPPVAAVTVSYPISSIRDDRKDATGAVPGFGQLHPRTQGVTTLGTIYSSSLFPGRAPEGHMLLLNYIGGAKNRRILDMSQEDIVAQVDRDLRLMLLKPEAPSPNVVGVRVWPRAIPQFNLGHLEALDTAKKGLSDAGWSGLKLGGNYVSGVALGKVVEYGYEFADELASYVASSSPVASVASGKAPVAV